MTTKKQIPTINKVQAMIDESLSNINNQENTTTTTEIINLIYPVNSIYITAEENINMSAKFPDTTWELYTSSNNMYMWKRTA